MTQDRICIAHLNGEIIIHLVHNTSPIRLKDWTWWIWLVTAALLFLGLFYSTWGFLLAIVVTVFQTIILIAKHRSFSEFSVQLRLTFTLIVVTFYIPPLRPFYWIPAVGICALVFTGYCLLARCLFLLPWNRDEPITPRVLIHTFFSLPDLRSPNQAKADCPGAVCTLEVQLGKSAP